MIWSISLVLLVLWLLGFVAFHVVGWWIHLILVLVVISVVFNLLRGRGATA